MESPTFGQQIKAAREELRISRADFARMCGVDYSTVANWELDRNAPKGPTLERVKEIMSGKVGYIKLSNAEEVLLERIMAEGHFKTREEFFASALVALITGSNLKKG